MENLLLITRTDIAQFKQISETVYDDVINTFIREAQFLDLQDLLGADFYNDLLRNWDDVKYTELLEGGEYTYQDITYSNVGLKTVLVYYADARYKKFGSIIDSPFSLIEKDNEFSTRVTEAQKQVIFKNDQQIAFKYWQNVKAFLNRKRTTYPLWAEDCIQTTRNFNISKII